MNFDSALARISRLQRFGRWITALVFTACCFASLALVAGLLDAWLAFEAPGRTTLVYTACVLLSLSAVVLIAKATRFTKKQAATAADRVLKSPRHPITAALSLPSTETTPLAELLAKRTLQAAVDEIAAIPANRIIPWKSTRPALLALLIACIPTIVLTILFPDAASTIAKRLSQPSADIAPWSKFRFALDPEKPVAIYGGELPLSVEITGAIPDQPVEFLIRRPGATDIQRLPTFRESETRFSRTLDSVTEPVSIAFAIGKARSEWRSVEILLQPKVLAGKTTITPPAYTEREAYTSSLDSNEIVALVGSEVILSLTSNRPLAPTELQFTPATPPGVQPVPQIIQGEVTETNTVSFRWITTGIGTISTTLRDVRGTPAAEPLVLSLKAVPDQAPVVDLVSPPRFLLATPSTALNIKGRAQDDFSLSKVRLVRTLEGFRDRTHTLAPALRDKAFDVGDSLPLNLLGVSPGQVIELFLEASDHNPSLLGQGSSEISRILIITEEEYAERIRAKTTLEEFNARYRAIADAMKESIQALQKMRESIDGNPEEMKNAQEAAKQAHQKTSDLLEKIANDFPAFETEKRLKELAKNAAAEANANLSQLKQFNSGAPAEDQKKQIDEMLERLGAQQKEQEQLQKDANMMAEAGKIMEMAAKFQQIYQTQASLASRILSIAEEIHMGNDTNKGMLKPLADTQDKNREALDEFAKELEERANAVQNPALAEMVESSKQFIQALKMANPQSVMEQSANSGRLGASDDAYVQAELARALLENLMSKSDGNCFAGACNCLSPEFSVQFPDVNQTMQQLLEALMSQSIGMSPSQHTGGGGMGGAGTGPTGNAAPGFTMPDIPVVGPQRMTFQPPSLGGSTDGKGHTPKNGNLTQAAESETLSPNQTPKETQTAPDPQSIPEPYREAVKTYFTP